VIPCAKPQTKVYATRGSEVGIVFQDCHTLILPSSNSYDVIIAGAGPAGSSAAIHLALRGARVLLVEQKKFPRAKLCGEFISPECLKHFEQLGVADRMLSAGGECLTQTVFYSRGGRSVNVPSRWFDHQREALGLSRAEMDHKLLERARGVGVDVLEETQVSGLMSEGQRVTGVQLKSQEAVRETAAPVVIDATGRTRALVRRLKLGADGGQNGVAKNRPRRNRPPLVAFKAHFESARLAPATCEIYFYPGGYGGLSSIENGLSNLCFIASAKDVRACHAEPERVLQDVVAKNSRAAYALARARVRGEWLAVSLESFGRQESVPADGLLVIGDAAAFIDPFTGSGMLMALEGGALAASVITRHLPSLRSGSSFAALAHEYRALYRQQFGSRLLICAMLRRAAFVPRFADAAIRLFGVSTRLRRALAQATRKG
jgi:flavin-dependent dehydrogenase